jgi:Ribonucleases P/MRP protein subunit POP1
MKMIEYWGYKVAEKANEKNWRAVHRYETHGCCVNDISYNVLFHLRDEWEKIEVQIFNIEELY